MAAHGARRLLAMAENAMAVIGIELLAAAQGGDFLKPLASSDGLDAVRARLRRDVAFLDEDRYMHPAMQAAIALVRSGAVVAATALPLPSVLSVRA